MRSGFVIGDRVLGASGDTHPDWMVGHGVAGSYLVAGASAVGQIHLARGLPRDDAFVVRTAGPWLAVGMSDGIGSRPASRYGATYVAEALTSFLIRPFVPQVSPERSQVAAATGPAEGVQPAPPAKAEMPRLESLARKGSTTTGLAAYLTEWTRRSTEEQSPSYPPEPLLQAASVGWWAAQSAMGSDEPPAEANLVQVMNQAFEKSHLGLRGHAQYLGVDLADLGCTALALLFNVETGEGVVGQVGDGSVHGLFRSGKARELVDAPDTGDPQSTYSLNRPDFAKALAVQVISKVEVDPLVAIFVMTDGLSGDLLYSPHPEALDNWAQAVDRNLRLAPSPAQAAAGMLNWLATYQVRGSWDDRTLVVITQRERNDGDSHTSS
ncbi:MAG: protein phosphatase 2C domain-containing protein [Bacillota bacterium]